MTDNEIALALVAIAKKSQPNISLSNGQLSFTSGTNTAKFDIYRPTVISSRTTLLR